MCACACVCVCVCVCVSVSTCVCVWNRDWGDLVSTQVVFILLVNFQIHAFCWCGKVSCAMLYRSQLSWIICKLSVFCNQKKKRFLVSGHLFKVYQLCFCSQSHDDLLSFYLIKILLSSDKEGENMTEALISEGLVDVRRMGLRKDEYVKFLLM